jgi:hypothetical protein
LALENFSSDAITIDWSIANLVKGRLYATLDFEILEDGKLNVLIGETENANVQEPFRLLSEQTIIRSHGKTVVVVEFWPKEIGAFAGCVAARSGEFIQTVGLSATVTKNAEVKTIPRQESVAAPAPS